MITEILQKDSPILRKTAHEVPLDEIKSPKIQKVLDDMQKAMHQEEDGVAIAAPQIGQSLRIFIVNGRVIEMIKTGKDFDEVEPGSDKIFINPVITKLSKSKSNLEEGCLSVRWLYGRVERSDKATVTAYDEHGNKFQVGASGLMAQIFQHETDHLDGILFIDKATDVENLPPRDANEI